MPSHLACLSGRLATTMETRTCSAFRVTRGQRQEKRRGHQQADKFLGEVERRVGNVAHGNAHADQGNNGAAGKGRQRGKGP